MMSAIKLTPHFIKCVENTISDFLEQNMFFEDMVYLKDIVDSKKITLMSATAIYTLVRIRNANYKYIKKYQDKKTFDIINKEHKYMKESLDKYFSNNLESSYYGDDLNVTGFVSYKQDVA